MEHHIGICRALSTAWSSLFSLKGFDQIVYWHYCQRLWMQRPLLLEEMKYHLWLCAPMLFQNSKPLMTGISTDKNTKSICSALASAVLSVTDTVRVTDQGQGWGDCRPASEGQNGVRELSSTIRQLSVIVMGSFMVQINIFSMKFKTFCNILNFSVNYSMQSRSLLFRLTFFEIISLTECAFDPSKVTLPLGIRQHSDCQ